MKLRKVLAVTLVAAMTMSMAACGGSNNTAGNGGTTDNNSAAADNSTDASNDVAATESGDASTSADGSLSYADIKLGEDYTDLTATISLFNHRTDLESDDYNGTTWKEYLAAFNEMYPNITVELTTDTNYADDALMHLQSGDYVKPPPCCIRPPRKRAWPAGPFAGLPACPMCCAYFPA